MYDRYYLISETKTCANWTKNTYYHTYYHKYTSGKLEERKSQKIGDSSNNDRADARKTLFKNTFFNEHL